MSISGISGSSFLQANNPILVQQKFQQFQQEFQQLGQDLQSGNLTQAQSDFATLQQNAPAGSPLAASSSSSATASTTSSTTNSNSLTQAFAQLASDLQSGNLSAAQSDYSTIQQDVQQNGTQAQGTHGHHHRHHPVEQSSQSPDSTGSGSGLNQLFSQLGQDLQSANLQSAQQAYTSLQQDFQQFAALGAPSSSGTSASASQGTLNISI